MNITQYTTLTIFLSHQKPFDLDDLLPAIGQFGRYQKLLLWLICLPACIPCGFCAFNQLFMADTPHDFWCRVPALDALNISAEQRRNLSLPFDEFTGRYSQCTRYAIDWATLVNSTELDEWSTLSTLDAELMPSNGTSSWPTESCLDGWVYNRSVVSSSIVIDVSVMCDEIFCRNSSDFRLVRFGLRP